MTSTQIHKENDTPTFQWNPWELRPQKHFCGRKSCFSGFPISIREVSISLKAAHIFPIRIHSMEDFKDSTGCVGYYTNTHLSPKAVLVLQINSPSVSAVTVSLTHVTALGRFQKSKTICGSTGWEKKDKQQGYSNLPFLSKLNRKRKHFYIWNGIKDFLPKYCCH